MHCKTWWLNFSFVFCLMSCWVIFVHYLKWKCLNVPYIIVVLKLVMNFKKCSQVSHVNVTKRPIVLCFYYLCMIIFLSYLEPQVRSIANHVRPDRQSEYLYTICTITCNYLHLSSLWLYVELMKVIRDL